ncbi:hypothetical protein SBADM41S_03458 [Streptomyces badius]
MAWAASPTSATRPTEASAEAKDGSAGYRCASRNGSRSPGRWRPGCAVARADAMPPGPAPDAGPGGIVENRSGGGKGDRSSALARSCAVPGPVRAGGARGRGRGAVPGARRRRGTGLRRRDRGSRPVRRRPVVAALPARAAPPARRTARGRRAGRGVRLLHLAGRLGLGAARPGAVRPGPGLRAGGDARARQGVRGARQRRKAAAAALRHHESALRGREGRPLRACGEGRTARCAGARLDTEGGGTDVEELAREAAANGADLLGVAGGDGTRRWSRASRPSTRCPSW